MRDYYYGFDIARLGASGSRFEITVATIPIVINTGTYAHVDISAAATGFSAFAVKLEADIDAAVAATYAVAFDASTLRYTISNTAAFTLIFPNTAAGNNAADLLGFARNTTYSAATSYTSVRRPFYVMRSQIDGQSSESDEYEPDGVAVDAEADDGRAYSVNRIAAPIYLDWTQRFEQPTPPAGIASPGQAIFSRDASTTVPWSWQRAFSHARATMPIHVRDAGSTAGPVVKMRAEAASFVPQRVTADYQGLWDVPFRTRLLGRITGGAPPAPRVLSYITGGSASNRYELTTTLFPGAAAMTIGFVFRDTAATLSGSVQNYICSKYSSGVYGYRANHAFPSPTFDRFIAYMTNSTPANVNIIRDSGQLWDGVKWHTCVVRLSGGQCSVWIDGAKLGGDTAVVGYTAASGNNLFQLYAPTGASNISQYAAITYAESALSDADIGAWHAQVSVANSYDFPGSVGVEVFDAADAAATWPGKKSYATVNRVGSVTVGTETNPVFA